MLLDERNLGYKLSVCKYFCSPSAYILCYINWKLNKYSLFRTVMARYLKYYCYINIVVSLVKIELICVFEQL